MDKSWLVSMILVVLSGIVSPAAVAAQENAALETTPKTGFSVLTEAPKKGFSALTESISTGFKRGLDSVSHAFTPDNHREAFDPTRLSSEASPGPELYLAVARSHEQAGRIDEAEVQYDKALRQQPDHLPSMIARAEFLDRQRRTNEAGQQYEKAVRKHPDESRAWNHLGLFYAEHRLMDRAATALKQAVKLEPNEPLYRNNLATVLVDMGETDAALAQLRAVEDEATASYNLGYLLQQRGHHDAAQRQFAAALRANPQMSEAKVWLEHLRAEKSSSVAAARAEPRTPVATAMPPRERVAQRSLTASRSAAVKKTDSPARRSAPEPLPKPKVVRRAPMPLTQSAGVTSQGSMAVAPLPPVSALPETPSYGTRNTNVVYPLPPIENQSRRR